MLLTYKKTHLWISAHLGCETTCMPKSRSLFMEICYISLSSRTDNHPWADFLCLQISQQSLPTKRAGSFPLSTCHSSLASDIRIHVLSVFCASMLRADLLITAWGFWAGRDTHPPTPINNISISSFFPTSLWFVFHCFTRQAIVYTFF